MSSKIKRKREVGSNGEKEKEKLDCSLRGGQFNLILKTSFLFLEHPDRRFHNSRALYSWYRCFWTTYNSLIAGFRGSKIVKCLVRIRVYLDCLLPRRPRYYSLPWKGSPILYMPKGSIIPENRSFKNLLRSIFFSPSFILLVFPNRATHSKNTYTNNRGYLFWSQAFQLESWDRFIKWWNAPTNNLDDALLDYDRVLRPEAARD